MSYVLVLMFACGTGCGQPASITIPTAFHSEQDCQKWGKEWTAHPANPQWALKGYECQKIGGKDRG